MAVNYLQIKTTLARPVHKVFDVVLTTEQKERLLLIVSLFQDSSGFASKSDQPVNDVSVNFYETVEEKGASGLTWTFGLLKSDESSEAHSKRKPGSSALKLSRLVRLSLTLTIHAVLSSQ